MTDVQQFLERPVVRDFLRFAMVGAGAVVTHNVDNFQLVFGNPARVHGWVTASGERVGSQAEAERRSREEGAL